MAQGPVFTTKVPYHWIQGLPRVAQEQIWRNFEELQMGFTSIVNTSGWDAIVDPNALADSASTKVFTSVGNALRALKPTGGWQANTVVNLGMRPGMGGVVGTVEPSAINSADCPASVRIVGFGTGGRNSTANAVRWDMAPNTQLPAGTTTTWNLENLLVTPGSANSNATLFLGGVYLTARNCLFDSKGTSCIAVSSGQLYRENYDNCKFYDMSTQGGFVYLNDCVCSAQRDLSWGYNGAPASDTFLVWIGGNYETLASYNMFLSSNSLIVDIAFGAEERTSAPAGTIVQTSGGADQRVVLNSRDAASEQSTPCGPTYQHSGTAPRWIHLTGQWANVTVPAGGGSNTGQNYIDILVANEAGSGTCDITGPAQVSIESDTQVLLRGAKITGKVSGRNNTQAVQAIGLTDSVVMVQVRSYGTASGAGFTLDAASLRNLILLGGDNDFPTNFTDSGTGNYVLTHTGPSLSGTAGGDLSGSYPNPTVVAIQGEPVAATDPGDANLLIHNFGTDQWAPAALSGDVTMTNAGVVTLANSGATAGSTSDIGTIPRVTVDSKGRVTAQTKFIDYSQAWLANSR